MLQIKIDDREISKELQRLGRKVRDLRPVMREAAAIIKNSVRENFEVGGRPKWAPSFRAKTEGGMTLVRSGILERSIQSHYDAHSAIVGTNLEYAAIHHFGGTTKPHVIRARDKKALMFFDGNTPIYRRAVNHPGSKIPARPFLLVQPQDKQDLISFIKQFFRG